MRAVCDTGPLLHLTEAKVLDVLRLIGEIQAPSHVIAELLHHPANWQAPDWLIVHSLDESHAAEAAAWLDAGLLHAGEAEAISLARQVEADWLLTDDAAARLFASDLGLEVHGSLGIILWAASKGFFDQIQALEALTRLSASSLWLSRKIFIEAQAALQEIYGSTSTSNW